MSKVKSVSAIEAYGTHWDGAQWLFGVRLSDEERSKRDPVFAECLRREKLTPKRQEKP